MKNRLTKQIFIIFLILLTTVPVILPFFNKGYFPTHDGEWAVVRMGDMFRSLRDLQFPVRYSGYLNFGYGYPLFNFVYPAPYYIGTLFHLLKIGFVDSVKLLFVLSVVLSAATMYFLSFELWRNKISSFISVIFYIYFPYRIVDLYARGSIGESLSFALFPIILFFILKFIKKPRSTYFVGLSSIFYALLIITHNIMAVLFTPVLVIFISSQLFFMKRKNYIKIILFFLLSYGLSAFFWLPALLEKQNILLSQIPIADREAYFVTLQQLLLPKWGYGLPDHPDGFSYQIGLAQLGILFSSIFLMIYFGLSNRRVFKNFLITFAGIFSFVTIALIILMFPFTSVIWRYTPLLSEINYPWTLLSQIGFIISLLSGFLWLQNKYIKFIVIVLSLMTIVLVLPNAKPELFFDKGDDYYLTNDATTTSSQELMPLWVKEKPFERSASNIEIINGSGKVNNILKKSNYIAFDLDLKSKGLVRINTIYYPGWEIKVDNISVPIVYKNSKGVMEIFVTAGRHHVDGRFQETWLRIFSNLISISSFIFLIVLIRTRKLISV